MPEAPVDEDRQPSRYEHEVRPHLETFTASGTAADDLLPTPTRPTLRPQKLRQGLLGREVTAPAHLGHEGATFGAGVDVRHVLSWI
jgi:hypothetical protein